MGGKWMGWVYESGGVESRFNGKEDACSVNGQKWRNAQGLDELQHGEWGLST